MKWGTPDACCQVSELEAFTLSEGGQTPKAAQASAAGTPQRQNRDVPLPRQQEGGMGEDAGLGCGGFWGSGNPVVFSWWLHNSVNLLNSHRIVHFRAARTAPHSSQCEHTRAVRDQWVLCAWGCTSPLGGSPVHCVAGWPGTSNLNPERRQRWKDGGPAPGSRGPKQGGETGGWGSGKKGPSAPPTDGSAEARGCTHRHMLTHSPPPAPGENTMGPAHCSRSQTSLAREAFCTRAVLPVNSAA